MSRYIKIGEASKLLGMSISTLRRWEKLGLIVPIEHKKGETRLYDTEKLLKVKYDQKDLTYAYARVSSSDQRDDLERQAELLSAYCTSKGWNYEILKDLGSGMNYKKAGLKKLLNAIIERKISRLVISHKDRLLRFGAELVFALCEARQVEVIIVNQGDEVSFEEELTKDVLEIITVFSARLYGSRSHKNKKLINDLKSVVKE